MRVQQSRTAVSRAGGGELEGERGGIEGNRGIERESWRRVELFPGAAQRRPSLSPVGTPGKFKEAGFARASECVLLDRLWSGFLASFHFLFSTRLALPHRSFL